MFCDSVRAEIRQQNTTQEWVAYRARTGNLLAHVVAVYDAGEARAVENFLKKRRAGQ